MKIKRLKELINKMDDNTDVFIRNSFNVCGNIQELDQLEVSTYGFFGTNVPCLILNTDNNKKMEFNNIDECLDLIEKEDK